MIYSLLTILNAAEFEFKRKERLPVYDDHVVIDADLSSVVRATLIKSIVTVGAIL